MAGDKYPCKYTADRLQALSEGRLFDQIIVVVSDLWGRKKNLESVYGLSKWEDEVAYSAVYQGACASAWMNEVELKLIRPNGQPSPWQTYAEKYGEGICCVREVLDQSAWYSEQERFASLGITMLDRFSDETGETIVYDLMERIGGLFAIHLDSPSRVWPTAERRNPRKICQINITTDDVDRTVSDVVDLFRIGPYGIGTLNNQTVTDAEILVDGEWGEHPFSFELAMAAAGNLEFEIIAPTMGPPVYQDYLDRRGVGYHHIKEIVPPEKLNETFEDYRTKGMQLCIKGKMDITTFAYLDSEEQFSFFVELGDGLQPNQLPEGYHFHLYPQD